MKQLALDIGLPTGPSLSRFYAGRNTPVVSHLQNWVNNGFGAATRSPVPTYLWGASGSGKTHLLKAVREMLREQGVQVGWMDASTGFPPEFDERWSAVVMDDVHQYTPMQQARAFNWFVNAINPPSGSPCWILSAGDAPPAAMEVRDDLRSRLGWGHVFQLHVPNEEERREVLKTEAAARGVTLSADVVDYMLKRFSRDLASLMQLLDMLDEFALRNKRAITIPLLKTMLETE
ncbi:DnaA regulatory inactivator Hda [Comamonas jiangduensis]|jgi:DnaA family protein|uniref:DnaA regulatory inactivator Hda n=1 Tax=Comamonas jiangduensis TaxID=1194168 RepID=A0ABV4IER8_9BURK|nr:DnaA regulatory inactivator Hda [Comamonas jiangduensis]QXW17531.1 DnaA regulatory inactivator Hda [Comamonas aquatica]